MAGYRVRKINGIEHWTLIGERDPMLPQMFYSIEEPVLIRQNDTVVG